MIPALDYLPNHTSVDFTSCSKCHIYIYVMSYLVNKFKGFIRYLLKFPTMQPY